MRMLLPIIALGVGACAVARASPPCDGARYETVGNTKVAQLDGKLFFRADDIALDFDGSPIAYGTKDQGQENICAGLAPSTGSCRGKYRGACYAVCQKTFADWSRSSGMVRDIPKTMCSVGLGGGECSTPDVRLQDAPHADYFVSETSLKTSPPSALLPAGWSQRQQAQLDPAIVRYIVAPPSLARFGVHYGDVGLAYNVTNHAQIAFIVGDCCGLGEASVPLLAGLDPQKPPVLTRHTNALGNPVMRYASGISGDFRFVIFAGTAALVPNRPHLTSISASALSAWIERTADAAAHRTSPAQVLACTAALKTPARREPPHGKHR